MRRPTPSGAVALLVLLPAAAPAGVVAADFVVLVVDHGLDHLGAAVAGAVASAAAASDALAPLPATTSRSAEG